MDSKIEVFYYMYFSELHHRNVISMYDTLVRVESVCKHRKADITVGEFFPFLAQLMQNAKL